MLSTNEPLDLKLPSRRMNGNIKVGKRSCCASICAPLSVVRQRLLRSAFPSPPSSPDSRCPSQERPGSCLTPPAMDLSLSPSSRHASSPSSFSPCPPSPASPMESSLSSGSPRPHLFSREPSHRQTLEGSVSPHGYPLYLPIESQACRYNLPSSVFIGQTREKRASPELSSDELLACRWIKCHLLFGTLQDLVDHISDYHVKPEKDSGYRCQWEGCARNGRGFNARYKMLIHIRTHTNEKPHHCPTCNKSFSRLENLKIHTRSHTGEKPYSCPYEGCGKRYSNSSDRFKHTRTHYVDKPYHCKMAGCLKRYTDPSSLRKHIKAHGHFVAQEQRPASGPGAWRGNRVPREGNTDVPFVGRAHVVVPTLLGGLGSPLPLSAVCHIGAFSRSQPPLVSLGGGGVGGRGGGRPLLGLTDSTLLPLGLSAASALGLHPLPAGEGAAEMEEERGLRDSRVLNLSVGWGAGGDEPLPWLVVPRAAFLLRPVVGS